MSDQAEAEIRNAALEEAAAVVGTVRVLNTQFASGYLMPRPESRSAAAAIAEAIEAIRALKSAPAADACRTDVRRAQPKRRPYNASASLSEYGIFPECDATPAAEAPAKGADAVLPPLPSCAIQTAGWDGTGVAEYYTADQMRAYALADRQQRKPWPMEEQPDGTVTPVDPIDRQQRGGDDFSGVQPPMRYVAGVNVDVLRRAALAAQPAASAEPCFCDRMYPDSNPDATCGDCPRDYWPAASAEPSDEEIAAILGDVLGKDVRPTAVTVDFARALLSRYGRPAGDAQPVAWVAADTLNSPHPTCVSSLAYMSQLDRKRGREYVPLYAAPVAAQQADGGDAPWVDWIGCESRRPFVMNTLRSNAEKMRSAEKRARTAYRQDFMGAPCRYLAAVYGKAAALFEAQIAAIDAAIAQQRKGER